MTKLTSLLLYIPMYFLAMLLLFYAILSRNELQSVEEYRLQIATNYCVDAAVAEIFAII